MELEIISPKYGKFIVYYDDSDHELVSKYNWRPAVSRKGNVYAVSSIYHKDKKNNSTLLMHIIIMGAKGIDHIDHNGLNNRRYNLRVATQRQNAKNMGLSILNKFGVKGVSYDKRKQRYSAHITSDYKHFYLGQFSSLYEAAIKYNEAAIKYHGEFASLNEITDELRKHDLPTRVWGVKKSNKSGYRGVGKMTTGKYYAKIVVDKKQIHLGSFNDKNIAAIAYNNAAIKHYGQSALLNNIII